MATTSQTQDAGAPATVFVVDDEPMLLDLASAILKSAGLAVRTFRDPQEALREFTAAHPRPALVVTDYAMGEMNGLDLMRECRRIVPLQKILLLSGTVDEEIYSHAPVKPDGFLAKPYRMDEFVKLVKSLSTS